MAEVEPPRDFREAMRKLHEAAERAATALRNLQVSLLLLGNEDLHDWNREMDNCYPNWPD